MQRLLEEDPLRPLHVMVVWEPVLFTDVARPTTATLALVHDRRARQYWDGDRELSKDLVRALLAHPERYRLDRQVGADSVVWDAVALFPRGALWKDDVPVPSVYGAPVVDAIPDLRSALRSVSR